MDKISKAFENLKDNKPANIGYIVAGYPSIDYTKDFINRLDESVLDILEVGIPYSDPLADGKVISNASFEAIQNGVNTDSVFDMMSRCKTDKCLIFMVYYNTIFNYGLEKFVQKAKDCGISGLIIPDLPCDESDEIYEICQRIGLCLVPLISITSEYRLPKILQKASGFIYSIGVIGVTGGKQTPEERLKNMLSDIKKATSLPVALGFGIKTNDDVKAARKYADGVIVGTSIVEQSKNLSVGELLKFIQEFFRY